MRWVLMTPLGVPVEPEVNRSLAIVSGPTLACAASTSGRRPPLRACASSVAEGRDAGGLTRATTSTSLGDGRLDRRGEGRAVADEDEARRQDGDDRLELGEILGDERIGRRDRRIRHARDHRAEPDQRMVDAVARQDRDRPLDIEGPGRSGLARRCARRCAPAGRSPCARRLASRSARNTRSGATFAQWSSQSVTAAGWGPSGPGERTSIAPSGRRSTIRPADRRSA